MAIDIETPGDRWAQVRQGHAASMVINVDRRLLYTTDGQPDRGTFGIDRSRT